jgi:serine O-acetyltransferase
MWFSHLRADIRMAKKNDPSAPSKFCILLTYPGIHALMFYRFAHAVSLLRLRGLARFISNLGRFFTNVDIHPEAKIGRGVFIDHGASVVIGQTAVIGNNVVLFHGVTLGSNGVTTHGKRHPNVEDGVTIYANSSVIGNITIGKNSIIGAHSVVKHDVDENSVVYGNPARLIKKDGKKVISQEPTLEELMKRVKILEEELNHLKQTVS